MATPLPCLTPPLQTPSRLVPHGSGVGGEASHWSGLASCQTTEIYFEYLLVWGSRLRVWSFHVGGALSSSGHVGKGKGVTGSNRRNFPRPHRFIPPPRGCHTLQLALAFQPRLPPFLFRYQKRHWEGRQASRQVPDTFHAGRYVGTATGAYIAATILPGSPLRRVRDLL